MRFPLTSNGHAGRLPLLGAAVLGALLVPGPRAWSRSSLQPAPPRAADYGLRPAADSGAWTAVNAAQDLRVTWRSGELGLAPLGEDAPWELRTALVSVHRDGRRAASSLRVRDEATSDSCLEWRRGPVVEWYRNDRRGLEQGFTLTRRPAGPRESALVFESRVQGLAPLALPGGSAVNLLRKDGTTAVRLERPMAVDARGQQLPVSLAASGDRIRLLVDDRAARYPVLVDPLFTTPSWTVESDQAGAEMGWSTASAGDVNRDGYADVIVGAWKYDGAHVDGGRAYVYLGSATGLQAAPAWTADGDSDGAWFGWSVASAGDVNGDGYGDVIIGALAAGGTGRAYLYYGSPNGLALLPAWVGQGAAPGAQYGASVASAGDVNRDGFGDLIVGSPRQPASGTVDTVAGRVNIYYGSHAGPVQGPSLAGASASNFGVMATSVSFGAAVASAGDVNGDGYDDVLIGDPQRLIASAAANDLVVAGAVFLYLGSPNGIASAPSWLYSSSSDDTQLGEALGSAGDVNGDGYDDVIIAAPTDSPEGEQEGTVRVFLGSAQGLSAEPDWSASGTVGLEQFGQSTGRAGDVDGDGYDDVIVGSWSFDGDYLREGRALVYSGGPAGLSLQPTWVVQGGQEHAEMGASVAAAGDVDGDGFADVLVGTWGFDDGQVDEGRAQLFNGAPASAAGSASGEIDAGGSGGGAAAGGIAAGGAAGP